MFCSKCGAKIKEGGSFCSYCGAAATNQPRVARFCNICHAQIEDDKDFCTACGAPVTALSKSTTIPQKTYCGVCHAEIYGNTSTCPACGARVEQPVNATAPPKNNANKIFVFAFIGVILFVNLLFFIIAISYM